MQLLTWKNSFLAFSLALLTACSTTSQAQNRNSQTADTSNQHHMNHHDMNHSGSNHNMAMDLGPADANYDLRFIDAMIPHHQGALNMANVAKQKSTRPEIKQLADEIIKAQTQEISQMKQWRKTWYPKAGNQPMAYDAKMGHGYE